MLHIEKSLRCAMEIQNFFLVLITLKQVVGFPKLKVHIGEVNCQV